MSGFLFFSLVCIVVLGMARTIWQGIQTAYAANILEAELRIHWKEIYPSGKAWDYFARWRNWRKILDEKFLREHPSLNAALAESER